MIHHMRRGKITVRRRPGWQNTFLQSRKSRHTETENTVDIYALPPFPVYIIYTWDPTTSGYNILSTFIIPSQNVNSCYMANL